MRNITAILQDPNGFMWFAGLNRLQRYDGYEVRDYRGAGAKPNSRMSFTRSMAVGSRGALWLARDGGAALLGPFGSLDKFDPLTDTLQPYVSANPPFTGPIIHVLEDQFGTLWLSTNEGLFRIDPSSKRMVRYSGLSADGVRATLEAKDGTFWVATTRGLDLLDRAAGRVIEHYFFRRNYSQTLPNTAIVAICEDSVGDIWAATPDGLARVDRKSAKLILYQLEIGDQGHRYTSAVAVYGDRGGALWIGTNSGLLMLNPDRTRLMRYRNNPADPESVSGNNVLAIYEDRESNMWVGTDDGGLDMFPEKLRPFKRYRHEPGNENSLDGNEIRSILEDSHGILWVATLRSLDRLDRKNGTNKHYRQTGGPGQLSNTVILSSVEDGAGNLWFGTLGKGLNRLDPRTGRFRTWLHDQSDPNSLTDDSITKLLINKKGALVVGTVAGLDLFDGVNFRHLAQVRVMDIAEDRNGTLWIATRASGLLRLDPATGERKSYRSSSAPGSLSDDQTTGLCVDHTGTVWVGTLHGLNRLDAATGNFRTYYEDDGLSNNAVSRILEDETDGLWVSTGYGISRLNPRTGAFTNYDATDGIAGNEFYGNAAAWRSPSGEMFFASHSGVTAFFPSEVVDNAYVPPVVITNARVPSPSLDMGSRPASRASVEAENKPYPFRPGMRFPPLTRDLQIDYAALSFVAPEKIRFKYKLEGYDSDWRDAGNRRRAFYTGLRPGEYVFHVIASNHAGVWNSTGTAVEFSIAPAYYQTKWFAGVCVAALMLMLWGLYRYRLHQIAREFNAQLDGRVDERLRVARELHDTLLQSFHGLLPRFQAVYNLLPNRVADAKQVLGTALDDAGKAITEARDAVQGMRSSTVVTNDLAKALETFGEELAAHHAAEGAAENGAGANGNAAVFSVEVEGAPQDLHPILRDEIFRIAAEALRNAFHHARAQRIEVELRYSASALRVRVRDDGVGIDPSVLGQEGRAGHFGLKGMRERAEHIGGKLEVWSERGAGTEIELTLPASVAYGSNGSRRSRFRTRMFAEKS